MALIRKGPLFIPSFCQVRHRGKINIQKPRVDKLPRRLFEALMQPVCKPKRLSPAETCTFNNRRKFQGTTEVNGYEEFLYRRCKEMFESKKMIAVCQTLPAKAEEVKKIQNKLLTNGMQYVRFNNNLMRRAATDTKFDSMLPLFTGRNSYIVSEDIKIKELVKFTKKTPQLIIMGVLAENKILSREETLQYAKLPGLDALRGELVTILGHGASKTHSLLGSHQKTLSVHLEQYIKQNQSDVGTAGDIS